MEQAAKTLNITVHIFLVILFVYAAPFVFDWRLLIILGILNFAQLAIFGGCILTIHQLKSAEVPFQEWLLLKLGVKINHAKFKRFVRWQMPFVILAAAIIWQVILGINPLIKI